MLRENIELFPLHPRGFEFPSVHYEMLHDDRRVEAYQKAIEQKVKPGDVVVDIGTGTGLLAMLAARTGASKVYAIEQSPIINTAREIAERNGFADKITFIPGNSRNIELPERADVIISELIGHLAFEEGIIPTFKDAKRRFLKPGGEIIPESIVLYAVPVETPELSFLYLDGWDEKVCGLDFSSMRSLATKQFYIYRLADTCLAWENPILSVCFSGKKRGSNCPVSSFNTFRKSMVTGIGFWFNSQLADKIWLTNNQFTHSHWQQCVLPLEKPLTVQRDSRLVVLFSFNLKNKARQPFLSVDSVKILE